MFYMISLVDIADSNDIDALLKEEMCLLNEQIKKIKQINVSLYIKKIKQINVSLYKMWATNDARLSNHERNLAFYCAYY